MQKLEIIFSIQPWSSNTNNDHYCNNQSHLPEKCLASHGAAELAVPARLLAVPARLISCQLSTGGRPGTRHVPARHRNTCRDAAAQQD